MAWAAIPEDGIIIANNDYVVRSKLTPGTRILVELDGGLGGRTITVGRVKRNGDFAPYLLPMSLTALDSTQGDMFDLTVGRSGKIAVRVAGGGAAPTLEVSAVAVQLES